MKIMVGVILCSVLAVSGCSDDDIEVESQMALDDSPVVANAKRQIIGSWLKSFNDCDETISFDENGAFQSTSSVEMTSGLYQIVPGDEPEDVWLGFITTVDNLEPDCSGNSSNDVDDPQTTAIITFPTDDTMRWDPIDPDAPAGLELIYTRTQL